MCPRVFTGVWTENLRMLDPPRGAGAPELSMLGAENTLLYRQWGFLPRLSSTARARSGEWDPGAAEEPTGKEPGNRDSCYYRDSEHPSSLRGSIPSGSLLLCKDANKSLMLHPKTHSFCEGVGYGKGSA